MQGIKLDENFHSLMELLSQENSHSFLMVRAHIISLFQVHLILSNNFIQSYIMVKVYIVRWEYLSYFSTILGPYQITHDTRPQRRISTSLIKNINENSQTLEILKLPSDVSRVREQTIKKKTKRKQRKTRTQALVDHHKVGFSMSQLEKENQK